MLKKLHWLARTLFRFVYFSSLMSTKANDLRHGNVISHKNKLYRIVKTEHVKPGKGHAYIQAELKEVVAGHEGAKIHERFRSDEAVTLMRLEEMPGTFLYREDDDNFVFMDSTTCNQLTVSKARIDGDPAFLTDGMHVVLDYCDNELLCVKLPATTVAVIQDADPVVKGQTAHASFKHAILENGRAILVPPHIAAGTKVVVDTRSGAYVERAREQEHTGL